MKKILFTSCLIVLSSVLKAQVDIVWQKQFGGSNAEVGYSVVPASDGGFVSLGYSLSNNGDLNSNYGDRDCWLMKTSSTGIMEWQKNFGGQFPDMGFTLINTSDGGYAIAGTTSSDDQDVSDNHAFGLSDYWILKISSVGDLEWNHCFGGTGYDNGYALIQTADDGFVMCGNISSGDGDITDNEGSPDVWLIKVSETGVLEWENNLGGASGDRGYALVEADDGGFMVVGESMSWDSGDVTGNHGASDFWVVRTTSGGDLIWQKSFGSTQADIARDIVKTQNGEYVICGSGGENDGDITGFHGTYDYWIIRINDDGDLIWQKCFGGFNDDKAFGLDIAEDGGFVVTGFSMSDEDDVTGNHGGHDIWLIKISGDGDMMWERSLGGTSEEDGYDVKTIGPTSFVILGQTSSTNGDAAGINNGQSDFWLIRLDEFDNVESLNTMDIKVKISPNPTDSQANFSIDGNYFALVNPELFVYDSVGKIVYNQKITGQSFQIDCSILNSGIYSFNVTAENYHLNSGKLVVK